ncbi:MAG: hypothetical protein K6G12_00665 [Lachnospiraceae bacterium]|nr:hypothetical protein [Lachnospiraceae bacterium]
MDWKQKASEAEIFSTGQEAEEMYENYYAVPADRMMEQHKTHEEKIKGINDNASIILKDSEVKEVNAPEGMKLTENVIPKTGIEYPEQHKKFVEKLEEEKKDFEKIKESEKEEEGDGTAVEIPKWRKIRNMLAKEGEDAPSKAELKKTLTDNKPVWNIMRAVSDLMVPVSTQATAVLERYGKDLEKAKGNTNIDLIRSCLEELSKRPENIHVEDFRTKLNNLQYNARIYRQAHDRWYRKRWGASDRLFKLSKNLEGFGRQNFERFDEILGKSESEERYNSNMDLIKGFEDLTLGENLQLERDLEDREEAVERNDNAVNVNENENAVKINANENAVNINENENAININDGQQEERARFMIPEPVVYRVDEDIYQQLSTLRDNVVSAKSITRNSKEYKDVIQIFDKLQRTALRLKTRQGDTEQLTEDYAAQVEELKNAAENYIYYKKLYRTNDQFEEPGKDMLNAKDIQKLNLMKDIKDFSFTAGPRVSIFDEFANG